MADTPDNLVSITPLLRRLWPSPSTENVTASEIALAISHIFTNSLSPVQTGALLTALHFTGWDRRADVIAKCSQAMRDAAAVVDKVALRKVLQQKGQQLRCGGYNGGLCDIVGTGGDSHSTFNISTTSSILASSLLLMAKHGNRASTSKSGSADLLAAMNYPLSSSSPSSSTSSSSSPSTSPPLAPATTATTPASIAEMYKRTNYTFLFAPVFHPGMRFVAPIRKELGWRTIFNLLGPLANPVEGLIEARVIGVARRDVGLVFAEALRMMGVRKGMVVCGEEELDEVSCAGGTFCWRLVDAAPDGGEAREEGEEEGEEGTDSNGVASTVRIDAFMLRPRDFGLSEHPLSTVSPHGTPEENAALLHRILTGQLRPDEPVLEFVLMNAAALFVVSGICDSDEDVCGGQVIKEEGPGGGRWKEGVRRARWCLESGRAWEEWGAYVKATNEFKTS